MHSHFEKILNWSKNIRRNQITKSNFFSQLCSVTMFLWSQFVWCPLVVPSNKSKSGFNMLSINIRKKILWHSIITLKFSLFYALKFKKLLCTSKHSAIALLLSSTQTMAYNHARTKKANRSVHFQSNNSNDSAFSHGHTTVFIVIFPVIMRTHRWALKFISWPTMLPIFTLIS